MLITIRAGRGFDSRQLHQFYNYRSITMKNRMNKRWRAEHLYSKNRRTPGNVKGSNQINNLAVDLLDYVRQTFQLYRK